MNDETKTNEDYRRVLATANKLETIQSNLESVIDFFLTPIVKLYSKLCNDCMKLLFECEFKLDHFRKAEELVWRRIYHDIYRFQKTKRQHVKRHDECLMESHFISGIGFYSSLIVKLRSHYKIHDVQSVIIPLNLTLGPLDNFVDNQRLNEEDCYAATNYDNSMCTDASNGANHGMAKEWARQAIYRSLVYMGDLARYLLETSQFDYRKLAFEFYRSASQNQPDHGLPFNQLATLAGGLNHNLDAVCNYMRCCLRPKPFEGAEGNMRKIFDLNKKFYEEISKGEHVSKISEVLSSKEPGFAAESMMKAIIVTFIKLTSDLWIAISNNGEIMKDEIIEETRFFFESLREAVELEPIVPLANPTNLEQEFCPISGGSSFAEKPKYVSPTIMYEFSSVSIMLIAKCQKRQLLNGGTTESVNNYVIDLVKTLALNLLHYSTSKCQKTIMAKVQELRVNRQDFIKIEKNACTKPTSELNSKNSGGNLSNSSQKSIDTTNSITETTSKRALSRLRQRKAATNYSDNSNRLKPVLLHTEDSDMSELEETALSTIDALEISSDMSEDADYQINDLIDLDSGSDEDASQSNEINDLIDLDSGSDEDALQSNDINELDTTLAFIYTQTYLPTIKIFCDWLLTNGEIINSNLQSFRAFRTELDNLVLLLNDLIKMAGIKDDPDYVKYTFNGTEWIQKYPLSCDFPLLNLGPLKSIHELNIDFKHQRELNDSEAGFVTIQCIVAFIYALTAFLENKIFQ